MDSGDGSHPSSEHSESPAAHSTGAEEQTVLQPQQHVEEPTEPEQAEEPTEPEQAEEPTEPEQVEEPAEPEQIEEPTELEQTEEPAEPEQVEEPAEPEQAEEPTEPEQVEEPAEPEQVEEPAEPEQVEEPAEPEQIEEPAEPEQVEEPTEPEQVEEPTELEQTEEPTEPEQVEEPAEPERVEEPAEPEQIEEPTELEQTEEPTELEQTEEPTEPEQAEEPEGPMSLVGAEAVEAHGDEKEELPPSSIPDVEREEDPMRPQQPSCAVQAEMKDEYVPTAPQPAIAAPTLPPAGYIVVSEVEVLVDATVHPMGFRVVIRTPATPTGEISTRILFESVAARLGTHPEVCRLSSRGERIRFGETLALEREDASSEQRYAGRLWVDVSFDEGRIPPHLQCLSRDDQLVRCIRARARLPPIRAMDLVAARHRGMSYVSAEEEWRLKTRSEDIVTVAILQEPHGTRMPYLGGYRSKKDTNRIFLHATTQLFSPSDTTLADLKHGPLRTEGFSRQTQTFGVTRSCQTRREGRTQTARPDYVLDETYDVVIIAKPYFTSIQLLVLQTEKAIVIQKMYRKWKARKIRAELAAERQAYLDRAAAQAVAEEAAKQHHEAFERQRRAIPRTADDFETLRRELEAWRAAEAARVMCDGTLSDAERRTALADITKRELQLLQEIEAMRRNAVLNRRTRRFEDILDEMSSTKRCGNVSITTQASERARELRQLFIALTQSSPSLEARLDTLLHIKWTVKEFDVPLTQEMVELVDREADLLHRGRSASSLKGLRTRLEHLFKRFIATPEYNPAVEEVVKGPTFGTVLQDGAVAPAASRRLKPSNVL